MKSADPLLYEHPLPIVSTFYPLGQAVELSSDSPEIAAAANAVWSRYPKLSDAKPVRLRISVSPDRAPVAPSPGMPRGQEHLVSFVHGPGNFAVADLNRGMSFACFTSDVAQDHAYIAYHFLEPIAYLLLAATRLTILHCASVALENRAVLFCGDSGAGKTCLAYACARKGWTFLSGDAVQFESATQDSIVIGRPFSIRFRESARTLFPELVAFPVSRGFNGKRDIEPPVESLNITIGLQARATQIVFLDRADSSQSPASLKPASADEAFRRIAPVFFFGDEQLRQKHRTALAQFLRHCSAFLLTYSDLSEAEHLLRSMVTETGLSDRS